MARTAIRCRIIVLGLALLAQPVLAQSPPGNPVAGADTVEILTLDQDRLYTGSRFGQKMLADIDAQLKTLQTENRRLEADLEAEEKSLTDRRAALPADEFRALADAFDTKVKSIRTARDAKGRDLAAQRDAAQKTFLKTAVPILAQILAEKGAAAIVDRSAIVLSFDRIDITDLAISRIDAQLLDGAAPPDAAETTPTAPTAD